MNAGDLSLFCIWVVGALLNAGLLAREIAAYRRSRRRCGPYADLAKLQMLLGHCWVFGILLVVCVLQAVVAWLR